MTETDGSSEIATGTNVFNAAPVRGMWRRLTSPDDVLALMDSTAEGVIACVADAGATFLAPIFDARRKCTGTFQQDCLHRRLLFLRTGQNNGLRESIDFDSRHAMRHAEKARLRVERADLLQRRLALHHDARLTVQLWPETQERLRRKLSCV